MDDMSDSKFSRQSVGTRRILLNPNYLPLGAGEGVRRRPPNPRAGACNYDRSGHCHVVLLPAKRIADAGDQLRR
jgi:hypothetical protein